MQHPSTLVICLAMVDNTLVPAGNVLLEVFYRINIFMSPIEGEGDILFLVRILLAPALALASASASA